MYAESAEIMKVVLAALLALCLPCLCKAIDDGLTDEENVQIDPLRRLVLNPGKISHCVLELRTTYPWPCVL